MSTSYGAVSSKNADNTNAKNGDNTNENAPLLSSRNAAVVNRDEENQKSTRSTPTRLRKHLTADVSIVWGDLVLLVGYIITGILDSSAIFIWSAFVSMQTGNTIYLGLGIVDPQSSDRWVKSIISIGSFCAGSFCFSRFHLYFGQRTRWVLTTSFLIQAGFIAAAAIMVAVGKAEGNEPRHHAFVPLGLIAFQGSGQAVVSRALKYNALTSVVLTSIYCDLFGDAQLFAPITQNAERNRRVAAPLLLLAGAVIGATWSHSKFGLSGALWTAVVLKVGVAITWLVWKEEKSEDHQQ